MGKLSKIIVILGPTASGKTDLGIALAKKFNGEIISADSRQVYQKMDIGTAKPTLSQSSLRSDGSGLIREIYLVEGVPHYMMDIVGPEKIFTLADYKNQAIVHIEDIIRRGRLPIIVGGTGLYIWAIVDNLDIPKMPPKKKLRESLEQKNLTELAEMLRQIDPLSAEKIDLKNPRRVIRALEVCVSTGESFWSQRTKSKPLFRALQIGVSWPREQLYERINRRCEQQIKSGLVNEVKNLLQYGYSWDLPSMSGLGYHQFKNHLAGMEALTQAVENLKRDTRHYAKKQMTWFKRDKRIVWFQAKDNEKIEQLIEDFLQNN